MFNVILTVTAAVLDVWSAATRLVLSPFTNSTGTSELAKASVRPEASDTAGDKDLSVPADSVKVAGATNRRHPMYTVYKAKEEIDAVAKHAMEIAAHALGSDERLNAKLDSFKHEILARIDAKFAELEKAILGETQPCESSAVSDLGAKVALLKHELPTPAQHQEGGDHGEHFDQGQGGEHHHD